eukprot:CAMPEP_0194353628 /NCGR_PEP_ID=MMETSP0174-20130528/1930_1 /TAXON_ID=216777 /ORGANISM="Proboscia alata, Strain PI-D3" /LENGTH=72 /DNA_ID=CAMNT_0039122263 /DNA_START=56 /DNA_END=270 /DNA_ORIENTATION=+
MKNHGAKVDQRGEKRKVGVAVLAGGSGSAKETVVRGAVAVADIELPLVYSENSNNDFGVNQVFEKATNFSKT